jgi:hypothetical protein
MASTKGKKKTKKTKKGMETKIILVPADDISSEEDNDEESDESGMYLDKESIQIIYNALHKYQPTEDEVHLHCVMLEEFEEILVVDYKEPYPDVIELRINNGYIQESGLLWEYETKWNFPTIGKKKTPGDCDAGVRQKLSNRSQ